MAFGMARKPQRTHRPERADELGEVNVQDLDGGDVRVGDLWRDGPVVLVFLRHYG